MNRYPSDRKDSAEGLFHPFEFGFCGFSGTGKTTLIEKLIKYFGTEFQIAYFKHDAHQFTMDHHGKDTQRQWQAGAASVAITDSEHSAIIRRKPWIAMEIRSQVFAYDWLFLEGFKQLAMPKLIFLDEQERILQEIPDLANDPHAFIGMARSHDYLHPYFHRDDIENIAHFIKNIFLQKVKKIPVYGLILVGGRSSRMGQDKALLQYHHQNSQLEQCRKLLQNICNKVFISARSEQNYEEYSNSLPIITDQFLNLGPLGGVLSAMRQNPQVSWLVIAIDMPYLDLPTLLSLYNKRNPFRFATVYRSNTGDFLEPLCTIYEPKSYPQFLNFLGLGISSLTKMLHHIPVHILPLERSDALTNINHYEEYLQLSGALPPPV